MKVAKARSFYFASRSKSRYYSTDDDYQYFLRHGDEYIDERPEGSLEEAFRSRLVVVPHDVRTMHENHDGSLFVYDSQQLQRQEDGQQQRIQQEIDNAFVGSHLVERKAPCKVDPKTIFAAERTFFTWVRSSLFLFGASITVLKYSHHREDPIRLMYGSFLFVVSIVFIIYPLIWCKI